jgi:hypothetical protein
MKRIWNALRYGDFETKKCIGSVLLFSVLAIVLIVVAGLTSQFTIFILGMISGIVALIISQTFTLVNDDFVAEVGAEGQKDSVRTVSVKKNGVISSSHHETEHMEHHGELEEGHNKSKKQHGESHHAHLEDSEEEEEDSEDKKSLKHAEFSHYNHQILKKIKRKYRVRRDHRPVLIDNSKTYGIKECPAFIWRAHNKVYLLLLEKEPRRICIPREMIRHVDYVPKVRANRKKEYRAFEKDNMVTGVYRGFLPDYFDSKAHDADLKYKNLYQIYPDIQFTNRSISTVMDLLCLNFMPEDKLTSSEKVNGFFKRVYAANILYRDKVYSITEYKDAVESALEEMCYAEIPATEFEITLENLERARFISQEYVHHYTEVRRHTGKKTVSTTYRR